MIRCQMSSVALLICVVAGCGRENAAVPQASPSAKPGGPPPVVAAPKFPASVDPGGDAIEELRIKEFSKTADEFEKTAKAAGKGRVYSWGMMMAATTWLEARDKTRALAAARAAVAAGPDDRSKTYTFNWHNSLAGVFLETGEVPLAIQQFEAALKVAPDAASAAATQQKLDAAKLKK